MISRKPRPLTFATPSRSQLSSLCCLCVFPVKRASMRVRRSSVTCSQMSRTAVFSAVCMASAANRSTTLTPWR
jgi:hypothetical protein